MQSTKVVDYPSRWEDGHCAVLPASTYFLMRLSPGIMTKDDGWAHTIQIPSVSLTFLNRV